VVNLAVLPGWALLLLRPRWTWSHVIAAYVIPAALGVTYLLIMLTQFRPGAGGFGSLAEVARLFEDPWLLLAGWIHYLAFDLFIGAWEVLDATRRNVPHWLVVPCLVLTFLLGPVGLLLYLVLRGVVVRRVATPA
jgi:hypothetical protein